ncbi:acetyl-CoA acetyltransferase [Pseudonocardia sp. EC080610-09]|uniref:thiolase family protein n=1 Tax=unclassified Pseudonocardia TaxID=2619320 RepID=UPI0006CB678E|nr:MULTISPECIES: acetyl-CoA C-acyltransferase [unclassified Pseudonocardia]ALE74767.1 acetyl-CoA acetyltransferase [Pseudonocardia sp. EC080625-04]ALL78202.1 acetyl-CoA acetyltransferase [Pseudonocardia sp. EC080610-09]ALL81114.1 acetyl-CoA acetyltransferase [Pseudonocardia sp. EC080619-01]ALL83453.1 acetyl-CoA acetyltransferase [Pseudonocardia sp. EC080619-01]
MRDAVIVEAVRSPVGKRKGGLAGVHPTDLSAHVLRSVAERSGVDPAEIEDVIWGCVSQSGEQTLDIARNAALAAGFPESVTGVTVDRQCGSSQQSVHFAAAGLIAGQYDVVVAGGVESMTRVPMFSSSQGEDPLGADFAARYGTAPNQGVGAEMIAEKWGFSRQQLDEFALQSHARAAEAQDAGRFDGQIAPLAGVAADEGVRRGGTLEGLAQLKTVFKEAGQGGVIHAGNSSQISDGSAALLMTTSEKAAELGLRPVARVHTAVLAGADPVIMLTAPIPATEKALAKSGLGLSDIGAFEVNEAFAPVPLAWLADIGGDDAGVAQRLNPNGGAIALGHPLGGSGARIMTTLVHHMRDNGIRYGLQTMCEGGGQANATILELL